MKTKIRGTRLALACGLLASGCGGGGSEAAPIGPIPLTLSVTSITQVYTHQFSVTEANDIYPTPVQSKVFFPSHPPRIARVRMLEDQPVLSVTELALNVDPLQPSGLVPLREFNLNILPDPMLAPGIYEGDFTPQFCQDADCASPLDVTGEKIHYQITVQPGFRITLDVDDVEVTNPGGGLAGTNATSISVHVRPGSHLDATSTLPVTWQVSPTARDYPSCSAASAALEESLRSSSTLSLIAQNSGPDHCQFALTGSASSKHTTEYVVTIDPS